MNKHLKIRIGTVVLAAAALTAGPAAAALAAPAAAAPATVTQTAQATSADERPAWPVTLGTSVTFTNNTSTTLFVSREMTDSRPEEVKPGQRFSSSGDYITADDVDIWVSKTREDAGRSDFTSGKLNITGNNPSAGYPWLRVRGSEFPSVSHSFSVGEKWSFTGKGWGTFDSERRSDSSSYKEFEISLRN